MIFPIKKRITTELFIDSRTELYIQKWEPNLLVKLKRVKCRRQEQQGVGMKNQNSSLFGMKCNFQNEKQYWQPA